MVSLQSSIKTNVLFDPSLTWFMPFQVLSAIDIDSDGMIKVDHVVKVLELLGNEEGKLSPKQIRHIVDMLTKEEMLEVEKNIEALLRKPDPEKDAEQKKAEEKKE